MNSAQISGLSRNSSAPISLDSSDAEQEVSRAGVERSRKTILGGWIISMIGIVFFCLVMSNSNQQPDLYSILATLVVISIGVGVWFVGCVRFMHEAANSTATETINW
ncbi:hypothetical protein [Georgfuchsia toluolica]|uniref:hypothetical protein n=1 Tax=Georgfuchsia toluolica TaxID=424218 RepID=UPI001C72CCB5|nr:hypothetical protein [Georgfuchsia toluolica]